MIRTIKIAAALALSLAAVPAFAQTTPASTTTSPNSPTTSCGTVCPSGIQVSGLAGFGGVIQGGFGTVDASGNLVAGSGITGTIKGTKTGGGSTTVNVLYSGPGCSINCGSSSVKADISAFERGEMTVTGMSSNAGNMLTVANSGNFAAAVGLSINYVPGQSIASAPVPPTPAH